MSRFWDYLTGRRIPQTVATGRPRTSIVTDPNALQFFDPALLHFPSALRSSDPTFPDADSAERWCNYRRLANDHVLRAIAETVGDDRLILRGSRLMPLWAGPSAREPHDLDWLANWPNSQITDPTADALTKAIPLAILNRPSPVGLVFDADEIVSDDIWTYERAPGRRLVVRWAVPGLPPGLVQVDIVFGELMSQPATRLALPAADGGCIHVWAATGPQSLAWKILWLVSDSHPQGKDLYDAMLLAERFDLPLALLNETLRLAGQERAFTAHEEFVQVLAVADWENFQKEYPQLTGDQSECRARLVSALQPTFDDRADREPVPRAKISEPEFAREWRTSTVIDLARGIAYDHGYARLPILADALQDAGCEEATILDHLRANGPHTTGCSIVERLLSESPN